MGCVPKKVMFNAAMHREEIQDMRDYGIDVQGTGNFNWGSDASSLLHQLII